MEGVHRAKCYVFTRFKLTRFGRVLGGLLALMLLPCGWSQTRTHPAEPQLDTTRPFVIRETYRQTAPSPEPSSPGIVGLDMRIEPGQYPLIQTIFPGTPAAQKGIRPGDRIIAINGAAAIDRSLPEIDAMISDVPGDPVALKILRGAQLLEIRLTVVSLAQVSRSVQSLFGSR